MELEVGNGDFFYRSDIFQSYQHNARAGTSTNFINHSIMLQSRSLEVGETFLRVKKKLYQLSLYTVKSEYYLILMRSIFESAAG
jgi:hypothetical protein